MSDTIDALLHEQHAIHSAYGVWGTDELAHGCAAGAAVPGFGGEPSTVYDIAAAITKAYKAANWAWETLREIRNQGVSASWAGDAKIAASQAAEALFTGIDGITDALHDLPARLETYAETVERWAPIDTAAIDSLTNISQQAAKMTTLGFLPNLSNYDSHTMASLHHQAMQAIDDRVSAHLNVRDAGQTLNSLLRDLTAGTRARRLAGAPLTALDDVILAEAGATWLTPHEAVLTPAQADRAAAALNTLNGPDHATMMQLLAATAAPEQRAYLLKALAAGHPVADIARFSTQIASHAADATWLTAHLTSFTIDGAGTDFSNGQPSAARDPRPWTQGPDADSVAATTVAARAAVDPLYALQLTTGGHPDKPADDNLDAATARVHAEQARITEQIQHADGMIDSDSTTIANQQIAVHSGTTYTNVAAHTADTRATLLPQIEEAVDDGHPVPITTTGSHTGQQLLIIGHNGDQLRLYHPSGFIYTVTADAFTTGDLGPDLDGDLGRPVSARLPAN